jgi:diguanylate cyclase (GGDEF)-like protein
MGGEEFLLLLPETDEKEAMTVAEELRQLVADAALLQNRKVTISIGVSQLRENETLDDWIKSADDALYRAKTEGRNRVISRNPDAQLSSPRLDTVKQ